MSAVKPTILVHVRNEEGNCALMQMHAYDRQDVSHGRYNAAHGQPRDDESTLACAQRILREHTGLDDLPLAFRGIVHWSHFNKNTSLFGLIFLGQITAGMKPRTENEKGPLHWVPIDALLRQDVPCWPGDTYLLPFVFDEDPIPFHSWMRYEGGLPREWSTHR